MRYDKPKTLPASVTHTTAEMMRRNGSATPTPTPKSLIRNPSLITRIFSHSLSCTSPLRPAAAAPGSPPTTAVAQSAEHSRDSHTAGARAPRPAPFPALRSFRSRVLRCPRAAPPVARRVSMRRL